MHNLVIKATEFYSLEWWVFIPCELDLSKVVIKKKKDSRQCLNLQQTVESRFLLKIP